MNLSYIPAQIKTVVIVNDSDFVDGGAAKVALMTAQALIDAGYETYLFSAEKNKYAPKIEKLKYVSTGQYSSLSDPNKIRGALNGLYNFKAAKVFKGLLMSLNPETTLVHIHTWTKALSSCVWNVAYSSHFPIYVTCHDYFAVCPNGGLFDYKKLKICHKSPLSLECLCCNCDSRNYGIKLYRFARGLIQNKIVNIFKKTSKFISISDFSENILKENFPKGTSFERVYNPIDKIEKVENIQAENNEYFLFVGRLSREKGCEVFCRAITDLGLKGVVVGEGPEGNKLREKFKNSSIRFVGWKNRTDVFEYMKKARALIFPSLWYETAGLSVLEALSIGLPCLVSSCCAASDFIKKAEDGCVFSDYEDLKRKLEKFYEAV